MAEETDAQLARMRRAMAKLSREGREREFVAVAEAYRALKVQQMEAAEVERREAVAARRAAAPAVRPSGGGRERWRLPRGFASPLAAQRAVQGFEWGALVPDSRRRVLSPWRGGHPAAAQIWRPGG